jgi:hypothetical protein
VQLLGPDSSTEMQETGGRALLGLSLHAEFKAAIAAADAVPRLVQMLGPAFPVRVQEVACAVVMRLTLDAEHARSVAAAGGIPQLSQLLGRDHSAGMHRNVVAALFALTTHTQAAGAIAAAGAIPQLVRLSLGASGTAGTGTDGLEKCIACKVLHELGRNSAGVVTDAGVRDTVRAAVSAAHVRLFLWARRGTQSLG